MDKGFIKLSRSFFDNKIWQAAGHLVSAKRGLT